MPNDARIHPRYEVQASVDLGGDEVLIHDRIQNISVGGICLQTPNLDEVGSVVDVVLRFPDLDAEMAVRGQVVWRNREPPQDVGIRWVDLDAERRALLERYIDLVKTRQVSYDQRRDDV